MPASESRRRLRWLPWVAVVGLLVIGLAVAAVDGIATYYSVRDRSDAGAQALQAGVARLHGLSLLNAGERLPAAQADFRKASENFAAARARLDRDALVRLAHHVPAAEGDLVTAERLLLIGQQISDFAGQAMAVGEQAVAVTKQQGHGKTPGERAADFLDSESASVTALTHQLEAIKAERASLPASALSGRLGPTVRQLDTKLAKLEEAWKEVPAEFQAARSLLGVDGPKTYLVVDLDSAELRSAGGFIGSFGFLHVSRGRVNSIDFRPIESLHETNPRPGDPRYFAPPLPIARHLYAGSLSLRDATWWPDFPTSAVVIERKLKEDEGTSVDGVIGIDPYFIEDLMKIAGPVTVPSLHQTFDAGNFYIQGILTTGVIESGPTRKDFLGYIGSVLEKRLLALPADRLSSLSDSMHRACLRRDLQITVHDGEATGLVNRLGCSGAMARTKGDYLFVVSAISGQKNNAWLQRSFALKIVPGPPGWIRHTLTMHFRNRAPFVAGYISPYYDDYLRIFIPSGSTWVGTTGGALGEKVFVPVSDGGYAEIGGHFRTVNNVFDVTLTYDVPAADGGTLLWERQSGTADDPVTVEVELGKVGYWSFALDQNHSLSW